MLSATVMVLWSIVLFTLLRLYGHIIFYRDIAQILYCFWNIFVDTSSKQGTFIMMAKRGAGDDRSFHSSTLKLMQHQHLQPDQKA